MHNRGHTLLAFPAMIFVGASWGANVPVSKVMLAQFDLIPMSAIRTAVAGAALGLLLLLVEGTKALRIDLDFRRFALLGLMMGGFALVAWPAEYGISGIKTFIVNQDGITYEKDLGPATSVIAKAMTRFNPDKSWQVSPDETEP